MPKATKCLATECLLVIDCLVINNEFKGEHIALTFVQLILKRKFGLERFNNEIGLDFVVIIHKI